jgi:enoyl-CoA hydratase/carnithine racemase
MGVVQVTGEGPVAELLLDRPEKLNALSPEVLEALIAAAAELDTRRDVKVVIVRGAGRAFSGGADLTAMGDGTLAALDLGRRAIDAVAGMRALTVAAVHGHCVGGALLLATACDLRVAAEGTRFAIPEVDLGLPLTWGGIPRLVRELGPALTKELVLTCRPFDAEEALRWRFVNRVVGEHELEAHARALADKLASQPAYSLELTKRHVDAVAEEAGSTAQSFREAELLLAALNDPESQQAMQRYLEAR